MIWFTSDLHFGHAKIIDLSARPFSSVERMNQELIKEINACVAPRDDLYILGDFSWRIGREEAAALRSKIVCQRVHLLRGNHDKNWAIDKRGVPNPFIVEPPIAALKIDGRELVMSHYPMIEWQGMGHASIHLHGHIHATREYNELNRRAGLLRYDVGVDANGYRPVSCKQIMDWFDGVDFASRIDWRQLDFAAGAIKRSLS